MKRLMLVGAMVFVALSALFTAVNSAAVSETVVNNAYMVAYALPEINSDPLHIVAESPSRAWFTLPGIDAVGRLVVTTTVDYTFTIYDLPAGSEPYGIALSGGYVWFTMRSANQIGRLNMADGNINSYALGSGAAPTGIAVAPNGIVWFAQSGSNSLGRLDPGSSNLTSIPYMTANAQLHDVAVQNNNSIWVTAAGARQIGNYRYDVDTFLAISTAETNSEVNYLALDGNVTWISAGNSNLVGRYAPGTLAIWRWYASPSPASGLSAIAFGTQGGVNRTWVAQKEADKILLIESRSGGAASFLWPQALPTPGSQPVGLSLASDGTVWVAASGSNEIVTWSPPYFDLQRVYLPAIQR
jgi:virginiamycin B lyase